MLGVTSELYGINSISLSYLPTFKSEETKDLNSKNVERLPHVLEPVIPI